MSVLSENQLAGASGQGGGYTLTDSVRFRASADTYLSRTNSSAATLATKATISLWVKRNRTGSVRDYLIQTGTGTGNNNYFSLFFTNSGPDSLKVGQYSTNAYVNDTRFYRDPSAWYHIVCAFDSTLGTAADRCKIWVNGELTTNVSGAAGASSNCALTNNGQTVYIGREAGYPADVYMTEFHLVDGQALTASDFGEYNVDTGVWQPKKYTGTYGNNGWYLDMSTSGSTVLDQSGNSNNWTATNMNLTTSTATTYDKMTDVPTLTDEDTGNFCTYSGVDKANATLSEGNLKLQATTDWYGARGTIALPSSGKFYWEVTGFGSTGGSLNDQGIGILSTTPTLNAIMYTLTPSIYFTGGGNIRVDNVGTQTGLGAWSSSSDVLGIAVDMDALTIQFYLNNSAKGTTESLTNGVTYAASCYVANGRYHIINFGQRPFAYTPPTGFKKLNTYNLPDSAIVDGSKHMNPVTYTGNGTSQSITGVGFSPDLVWIKFRSSVGNNELFDTVRGAGKYIVSNLTTAELTSTNKHSSFDSDGFSVGSALSTNTSGGSYVSWNWRGSDSTAVSNTDGGVTSTVSANTTAGISIVTADNLSGTSPIYIGHGLGVAPDVVIGKIRDNTSNWYVQHTSLPSSSASYLMLNSTAAYAVSSNIWDANPSTTTFRVGNPQNGWNGGSATAQDYVFYCFAPVEGFSKFGKYTGNASTDGPFVYTGFRPAFVMTKCTSTTGNWMITDIARNTYNVADLIIMPNNNNTEYSQDDIDILSNGFKMRDTLTNRNASGATFIYMAFAENPFKNSLAR